jgi:hypothetical protein
MGDNFVNQCVNSKIISEDEGDVYKDLKKSTFSRLIDSTEDSISFFQKILSKIHDPNHLKDVLGVLLISLKCK